MDVFETLERISTTYLVDKDLRYCLVDKDKKPYRFDTGMAKPNNVDDFCDFETLLNCDNLDKFYGIGISIQASEVCAIDVDHCFSIANDITSADERAKDILNRFKDNAYCEFSFSGTGLRILFYASNIDNYSEKYYIKNDKFNIEYYQPGKSFRYVTLTGNCIYNNDIHKTTKINKLLETFLNDYMKKPEKKIIIKVDKKEETRSYEQLRNLVKYHYLKNNHFQDLWFGQAPGSGKNESELDYELLSYLYENITQDKELLKKLFESSSYFKSKDSKHISKWYYQDNRYYNYLYDSIERSH